MKSFKVAAVSKNTNSFGLHGVLLVAEDGECWQIGMSYINIESANLKGHSTVEQITHENGEKHFVGISYEIPEQLPKAPRPVINELYEKNNN